MSVTYKGIDFSPRTFLTVAIPDAGLHNFVLSNIAAAPVLAGGEYGYLTLSKTFEFSSDNPSDYEVIRFTVRNVGASRLEGITRGVAGLAQAWPVGSWCACTFGHTPLAEIIAALNTNTANIATRLPLSGGAMTGNIAMATNQVQRPNIIDYAEVFATAAWNSATQTINLNNGNVHNVTITVNVTSLSFTNARAQAYPFTLMVRQDTVARAITWPASVVWDGGIIPSISTVGRLYVFTFFTINSGTTWYGMLSGDFA